jgi:hypothetical protein
MPSQDTHHSEERKKKFFAESDDVMRRQKHEGDVLRDRILDGMKERLEPHVWKIYREERGRRIF